MSFKQEAIAALDFYKRNMAHILGEDDERVKVIERCIGMVDEIEEETVVPHRNYQYLSDYWCACGWHLGKSGAVNFCSNCGKKVIWDE